MQCLLLLVVAAFAQGSVLPNIPSYTPYGYIPYTLPLERVESQRIIGGSHAALGQFPYQVALLGERIGVTSQSIAGGSLISANRVLTAAHNWFSGYDQYWRFIVVLGSTALLEGGTRIPTSNVVLHPLWNPPNLRNDIAVVYLPSSVSFSATIAPVSLPTGSELSETFAGSEAIASGFGITETGSPSLSLRYVRLNIITNEVCRQSFASVVEDSNICTSGAGNIGICTGDSGGPLVVERGNRRILVGVTSFGSGRGCQSGEPSGFARVSSFMSFILENMS